MPLDLTITSEQKIPITASPTTAVGNPAAVEGAIRISVVSGDASFEAIGGEPLSAFLISGGVGDTVFVVSADADLGAGEVLIQDTITLHVVNPFAANIGLSAGAAEAK